MSDLISRQYAIDALGERPMVWVESDYELGARNQYDADVLALETVPPAQPDTSYSDGYADGYKQGLKDAQPERKRGKWKPYRCDMYECSECGYIYTELTDRHRCGANFCPHCGAKMEVSE